MISPAPFNLLSTPICIKIKFLFSNTFTFKNHRTITAILPLHQLCGPLIVTQNFMSKIPIKLHLHLKVSIIMEPPPPTNLGPSKKN